MKEGDEVVVGAAAGLAIDGLESCRHEFGEGGPDVGYAVAQVVQAGAAALEESSDRRVGCSGREELDAPGCGAQEGDFDTLRGDGFPSFGRRADDGSPDGDRLVERGYGNSNVIQGPFGHREVFGGEGKRTGE